MAKSAARAWPDPVQKFSSFDASHSGWSGKSAITENTPRPAGTGEVDLKKPDA